MPYRLIAVDLDDTLLTDDLTVSEPTRQAIADAIAQGAHVTIATGRMFESAQRIARQVGLNVPIITYQGSLIKNLLDEQVLYERSVPVAVAARIHDYCVANGLHLQTFIADKLYAAEENDRLLRYAAQSKIPYTIEPDFKRLISSEGQTKMLAIDEPERLDALLPELKALFAGEVHVTKSKPNYVEFTHVEGTKGHALRFLAAHYGIPIEETIGVGDAMNDREMIETAGLGVAMANAAPSLKEIADFVTLSNNDDGVKHVLDKFVLNRA